METYLRLAEVAFDADYRGHADTARVIGGTRGLKPGAISGAELKAFSDEELARRLR